MALDGETTGARNTSASSSCLAGRSDVFRGTAVLPGTVALAPAGAEGFGFDPVFVPDGEARTVAELGDAWKALHSHRALAARALRGCGLTRSPGPSATS